jgi:Uma2 family endonuclease
LYAMNMQVTLPADALPATLKLNPELRMSDNDYYKFCMANPRVRFERTAQGEIVIVPPAGFESDYRNTTVLGQLEPWARRDGRGKASGPSAEFILPTGAALSPDAAWVSNKRISKISKIQRRKFPPLCPEFVIEVMSPSDRLKSAKEKMEEWIRAGVQLGWLIDGDKRTVYIYRAGRKEAEKRTGIPKLAGEGPVAGFELDLTAIWAGL